MMLMAASGFPEKTFDVATYDAIRPGCWKQRERLLDMDANHVEASLCFPTPYPLGLPSIHSRDWDPLFSACQETDTVVCMHIGSSSRMRQHRQTYRSSSAPC